MNKLLAAVVFALGLAITPVMAAECQKELQFEYSRDLLVQYVEQGVFAEGYILDTKTEVVSFLLDVEKRTGLQLDPYVEKVLAIVVPQQDGSYVLMIFGFVGDCQVGQASTPVTDVEPGLLVDPSVI